MLTLSDQAARDIISNEMKLNLMVEAGAGSGKTQEMSKRILALISSGYREISEIAAITFTRKAANELRERVRLMLQSEYDKSGNELQKNALDNIHECFIGTIHSFCGKLLRERPIEAGIDPEFDQIDEAQDALARRRVWETYVFEAGEEENEILRLMDVFGVKESAANDFLQTICDNPDVEFVLPDEPETSYDEIMSRIKNAVHELNTLVHSHYVSIPKDKINNLSDRDKLQKSMIKFRQKIKDAKADELSEVEQINLLMFFSTKESIKLTQYKWGETKEQKSYAKGIWSQFQNLRETTIVPLIADISVFVYNSILLPFALEARELYLKHKHTVAELSYQDLLSKSADMLRDYPDVRRYFQSKYKTLLIDEFQDTDPIQIRMSMYLTGKEHNEKRWNKITPCDGSLFVVGDPKQSIYGFRRADFDMYRRFQERMKTTGGKLISLQTNFRAVDKLGEWYNKTFPGLLYGEGQAEFTQMDTVIPEIPGTLAGVAYYRIDESKVPEIIGKDPEILSGIINHFVGQKEITVRKGDDFEKRNVRYKDIMILAMMKDHVEAIGNGIAQTGIPVKITGTDITKRTSEFVAFRDLVRLLAYPEENAYLSSVMSGDFFSFSDYELFRYHSLGGGFSIYFDFESFVEENTLSGGDIELFNKVRECFGKLRHYLDYMKSLSPAAAAERIIEELGILKLHLTSDEKVAGLSSFVSLVEKIRHREIADVWGLDLFINELSLMIENGFEEDVAIEGKDFDAVRILNTHKAKGLEAPIVILCAPCSGGMKNQTMYTECVADKEDCEQYYGYARVKKYPDIRFSKECFEPAGWTDISEKAKEKAERERDRLLYVAATRAKNLLIISDSASKSNPWSKLIKCLPPDAKDLLDEVYNEEAESTGARESAKTNGGISNMADTIDGIKARRDEAFLINKPTFEMYTPSGTSKPASTHEDDGLTQEQTNELAHSLEKTIKENTMVVTIDGEESELKTGRLEIGTVVHRLLEVLVKDEAALPEIVDSLTVDNPDGYITTEFLEDVVTAFKSRKLYDRIKNAEAVYTEVPFSYKVTAGSDYAGNTFERDTYVNGIIDLVFKENGKWVIIDYKTHSEYEVSHELREEYAPQLKAYTDVWEELTGEPVAESELFFIMKRVG